MGKRKRTSKTDSKPSKVRKLKPVIRLERLSEDTIAKYTLNNDTTEVLDEETPTKKLRWFEVPEEYRGDDSDDSNYNPDQDSETSSDDEIDDSPKTSSRRPQKHMTPQIVKLNVPEPKSKFVKLSFQNLSPTKKSGIENSKIRTVQAELRTVQAESRTVQAESRSVQAESSSVQDVSVIDESESNPDSRAIWKSSKTLWNTSKIVQDNQKPKVTLRLTGKGFVKEVGKENIDVNESKNESNDKIETIEPMLIKTPEDPIRDELLDDKEPRFHPRQVHSYLDSYGVPAKEIPCKFCSETFQARHLFQLHLYFDHWEYLHR